MQEPFRTREKKVLTVFGTRPEVIKLAPVIEQLEVQRDVFRTVNVTSAQHTDLLYPFVRMFGIRVDHDLHIMEPNQTPNQVCARVLARLACLGGRRGGAGGGVDGLRAPAPRGEGSGAGRPHPPPPSRLLPPPPPNPPLPPHLHRQPALFSPPLSIPSQTGRCQSAHGYF